MKNFILKILQFSLIPILCISFIVGIYYLADPYQDFRPTNNYSWTYRFQNAGDLSTKKFLKSDEKYNSFILGSSRSISLYACYLNKLIENSNFYHFVSWNDNILGMYKKLTLIDSLGYPINNVVVYIDTDNTFSDEYFVIEHQHYLINGKSLSNYYYDHFSRFFNNLNSDKIKILFGLDPSKRNFPNLNSDVITNDHKHQCSDTTILSNYGTIGAKHNKLANIDSLEAIGALYDRPVDPRFLEDKITNHHVEILHKIKNIFAKHSTNYKIIITPLYDQNKFSPRDNNILVNLFGDSLYDFSGINKFTNNKSFYPDGKHFLPFVSKSIADSVFAP